MLAQGWITHPQLQKALAAQRESGTGRIGEWLMSECGVEAEQITAWPEHAMGMSGADDGGFSPEAMALVMPKMFVENLGCCLCGWRDRGFCIWALRIGWMPRLRLRRSR